MKTVALIFALNIFVGLTVSLTASPIDFYKLGDRLDDFSHVDVLLEISIKKIEFWNLVFSEEGEVNPEDFLNSGRLLDNFISEHEIATNSIMRSSVQEMYSFKDGWGRRLLSVTNGNSIAVVSLGVNGLNDELSGDDIWVSNENGEVNARKYYSSLKKEADEYFEQWGKLYAVFQENGFSVLEEHVKFMKEVESWFSAAVPQKAQKD